MIFCEPANRFESGPLPSRGCGIWRRNFPRRRTVMWSSTGLRREWWCLPMGTAAGRMCGAGVIPRIGVFWMISDLTPRKGHFSFSPWQRHGKTVPQKECSPKGHPNTPGPSESVLPLGAKRLRITLRGCARKPLCVRLSVLRDGPTARVAPLRSSSGGVCFSACPLNWHQTTNRAAIRGRRSPSCPAPCWRVTNIRRCSA